MTRPEPAQSPCFLAYLLLTAVISGALVMVVEVMGSRVIGPFFGVSLFVWTSLITVTLLALALGYAVGGELADRAGTPNTLYGLLALAGAAALLVPLLKAPVIKACAPLGLRTGALVSSLLLFGPCLALLGCVSPLMVRIATREMDRLGRTVGLFFALSTLGSVLGTVLTGFVLIAYLGVGGVFRLVGGLLIGLAALYFAWARRSWLPMLALLLPLAPLAPPRPASKTMANGTRVTPVDRREGFYGTLQVIEYSYGAARTRELVLDGLVQTGIDVASGLSVYEYAYFMQHLPYGMNPAGRSCLVVGLGGGVVPGWYQRMGIRTDVVDINPDMLAVAREHFGFRPAADVSIEDARTFLARPGRRYDYIVLDVFTGDLTPSHLLTLEALELLRARLAPGGLLAMNLAGSLRHHSFMTASILRTLEQVFPTVETYPTFAPEDGDGYGNLAVIARDGPPLAFQPERVAGFPVHALARDAVTRFLGRPFRFPPGTPAMVLTDDFNPLDVRESWLRERIRRGLLEATDWDVLL